MDVVKIEVARGVLTATLADIENRNALGGELLDGLRGAIRKANDDASIRAVVVTNEGSTFCAGANLKQRSGEKKQAKGGGGFVELLQEIQIHPNR
jgi:enoyl-CoA hydratase/carnithine racemase